MCEKVQNSSDLPKIKFYLVSPHVSTKSRYHFLMDPNQLLFIIARFMLERLETLTPGFQVPRKALEGTASLVYCYFRQLELLLLVRTPRSARQSYRFCRSRRVTITFPKHFLHGDEDTYFFPGKIGMFISH